MADLAQTLIEQEEGCRLTAYKDSLGYWTCGYGHRLPDGKDWTGYSMTQQEAEAFLGEDMSKAKMQATEFPYFYDMNDVRKAVCTSMCFQLGVKPLSWPHFMAAMFKQDYTAAAAAGLDSLWAKQTRKRAIREMGMMASGNWIPQDGTTSQEV